MSSVYVEQDCTFTHEGKAFTAGGAYVTPDRVYAYLARRDGRLVVTDWHGRILSDTVKVVSCRPHRGWISHERLYIRFRIDGATYSGISLGAGLYLRARRVKGGLQ
jgi:hypothetical protein